MKKKVNDFIDWFESKFNIFIDILALIGGAFCIFFAIFVLINILIGSQLLIDVMDVIILPGVLGFFGVMILFALRITRHLTKK